jgi:uncharacterized protein (TIGR03067 family)
MNSRRVVLQASLSLVLSISLVVAARPIAAEEPAKAEPAKADIDVVQGKWKIATLEINGQSNAPGDDAWIEFTGDRVKSNQQNELFKVKLDSTTDPKLIDLERIEGSDATQSLEGIYTIKDDKLTICISAGEGVRVRPTEFTGKEGSGCVLVTFERVK